ncbi:MAG TPA: hypothetical protein VLN49_12225, partial [Gemmatimonadaceae bacterium]|nr:hypothetical protein [Gemmatimonadaceae bacterium]
YQNAVHQMVHRRPNPARFHVRGFMEQGTTTTPFDMVVLNGISRFQLAALALKYAMPETPRRRELMDACERRMREVVEYTREHLEDPAEIRDWVWTEEGPDTGRGELPLGTS